TSAIWYVQGKGGVPGQSEPNDWFGYKVSVGDFSDSGADDVVVGVPFEDVGPKVDAGAVTVLGSTNGKVLPATAGAKVLLDGVGGANGPALAHDQFGYV